MPLRADLQPRKAGAGGARPRPAVPGEIEAGRRGAAPSTVEEAGGGSGGDGGLGIGGSGGASTGGLDALSRLATVLSAAGCCCCCSLLSIGSRPCLNTSSVLPLEKR
ncbi:unnamed protein product [Urochloa humidicola]